MTDKTVYEHHLGERFQLLPRELRDFHLTRGRRCFKGEVTIDGAATVLGRVIAFIFRLPTAAPSAPFRFELNANAHREVWTRHFPSRTMSSCLSNDGAYLVERFGPVRLLFLLSADTTGIAMHLHAVRVLGLSIPKGLLPQVKAEERASPGRLRFEIEAGFPAGKRLVGYRGSVEVDKD